MSLKRASPILEGCNWACFGRGFIRMAKRNKVWKANGV